MSDINNASIPEANPFSAPSPATSPFCTHCGNAVSPNAAACLSCGAKPTGHKRFCRQCGAALNPVQIVCIKCGVKCGAGVMPGIDETQDGSSTGCMFMHLTWFFAPLITLIIWAVIKDTNPAANQHGKSIFNAWLSTMIYYLIASLPMALFILAAAVVMAVSHGPNRAVVGITIPMAISVIAWFWITIQAVVSSIRGAIAANRGEVFVYRWAIRFFRMSG